MVKEWSHQSDWQRNALRSSAVRPMITKSDMKVNKAKQKYFYCNNQLNYSKILRIFQTGGTTLFISNYVNFGNKYCRVSGCVFTTYNILTMNIAEYKLCQCKDSSAYSPGLLLLLTLFLIAIHTLAFIFSNHLHLNFIN